MRLQGTNSIQERWLFHGTDSENIASICTNNFDLWLAGQHGKLYGKGNEINIETLLLCVGGVVRGSILVYIAFRGPLSPFLPSKRGHLQNMRTSTSLFCTSTTLYSIDFMV